MQGQLNSNSKPLTDDGIAINLKYTLFRLRQGLRHYWLPLLLVLLSSLMGAYLFWANTYQPTYKKNTTYAVTMTGLTNQDNLAAMFIKGSFNELSASKMNEMINNELNLTDLNEDNKNGLGPFEKKYGNFKLRAKLPAGVNMLQVSAESTDPEIASKAMEVMSREYPAQASKVLGNVSIKEIQNTQNIEVVEDKENRMIVLLIGLGIGAMLDLLFLILYSTWYKTVQSTNTMNSITNLKKLGTLSEIAMTKSKRKSKRRKFVVSKDLYQQEIKSVALKLNDKETNVVMLVSTSQKEGVTKTTSSLANFMNTHDKPSIVLCLDDTVSHEYVNQLLDDPSKLNKMIKIEGTTGFLTIGAADFERLCRESDVQDPHNELQRFFNILKNKYYMIFIDALPMDKNIYLPSLAQCIDQTIYIVKQGEARIKAVQDGLESLENNGFSLTGYILNYADPENTTYGSYAKRGKYDKYYSGLAD